jgi:hypothetical protein
LGSANCREARIGKKSKLFEKFEINFYRRGKGRGSHRRDACATKTKKLKPKNQKPKTKNQKRKTKNGITSTGSA